jgi:tetratricopeptide (TPR) repeat protein
MTPNRVSMLPEAWELGSFNWHVFILYKTDVVRVIDLYDVLRHAGYEVLHERHRDADATSLDQSGTAILVMPPADPAWSNDREAKLRERAEASPGFRYAELELGPEKQFLRATTVLNTIFRLIGKEADAEATRLANEIDREASQAVKTLKGMSEFPASPDQAWRSLPGLGNQLAEVLIGAGCYTQAIGVLQQVEKLFPRTLRYRQLSGLAYRRSGDLNKALQMLQRVYDEGQRDPETLGMYASTLMDCYDRYGNGDDLQRSRDTYLEAFRATPADYYTGINAASKSAFLRDIDSAREIVKEVQPVIEHELRQGGEDYWLLSTAAEAQLISGDYQKAADLYYKAVLKSPRDFGSQLATWLQARRLMDRLGTPEKDRAAIWRAFQLVTDASPDARVSQPTCRRLRVFAFDPGLARRLDTAPINEVTLQIPWEGKGPEGKSALTKGPVGEYLEVIDYDPASGCFYEPVDLDDQRLLAADGLAPSEGDPGFHQQMVYAVAMNLIDHFERALGRRALWAGHRKSGDGEPEFVHRLRIYPHALREANAYYSPAKKAVLFGYFRPEGDMPERYGTVFACLSHDVIAHEVSHALLDGLHPRFTEPSNGDVLAFHEAFADLVALFQHFSHSEVLRHEIARTRSDLGTENLLGQLAQQFGRATGRRGALRDAIGMWDEKTQRWRPKQPSPQDLDRAHEPHDRGAVMVAAVFDAFLAIYKSRTVDLLRIATQGSGILAPGALHPDLVGRLAREASRIASHFLRVCIRALDYCPPVDITLGDYLRALITADVDFVPDDRYNYRLALLEGFGRRGIYPNDVRNISVDSLVWRPPRRSADLTPLFGQGGLAAEWTPTGNRRELWESTRKNAKKVKDWLDEYCSPAFGDELGLALSVDAPRSVYRDGKRPEVEVHSVRLARRSTPQGGTVTDLVVEIMQRRRGYFDPERQKSVDQSEADPPAGDGGDFTFYGGCTLLIAPSDCRIRYAITKHVLSDSRLARELEYRNGTDPSLRATYFGDPGREAQPRERFALLHGGV